MKSPKTAAELADAIESLVATYMDEVRRTAQQALERGLVRQAVASLSKGTGERRAAPKTRRHRSSTELKALAEALCDLVHARPGASMAALAEQMGATGRSLEQPMIRLKAAGRVRSVGQRHMMRYFPAVVRSSTGNK